MIKTMTIRKDNMETAALGGFTNATDLADYLVKKGLPFRETHAISGKLVHYCIENGISLLDVSLDKLKEFSPAFEEDVYDAISLKTCVEGRKLIGGPAPDTVKKYLEENYPKSKMFIISAEIESELSQLEPEEKEMFLEEMGMTEGGMQKVIRAGYEMLDMIVYFTAGKKECRAWQIKKGTKAPQAAGIIHSDFERGFIRAEVTKFDKLVEAGDDVKAKELGYTRVEGKDYVIEDGDVVYFRFNV